MKKKLSLDILKGLEPYIQYNNNLFCVIEESSDLLTVKDKEEGSDFQFTIKGYEQSQGRSYLRVHIKPISSSREEKISYLIESAKIGNYFEKWVNLLIEYNNVKSFFDDLIVEAYSKEFYTEFELLEEDAQIYPYDTNKILEIDTYLENLQQRLPEYITEQNETQILDIQKDIREIRDNITSKTKQWVTKKVSVVWAKLTKLGTQFIKDFVKEGKKQLIEVTIKAAIEVAKGTINLS
ncbi:hypothetical protein [Dysgonomonas sp.]